MVAGTCVLSYAACANGIVKLVGLSNLLVQNYRYVRVRMDQVINPNPFDDTDSKNEKFKPLFKKKALLSCDDLG